MSNPPEGKKPNIHIAHRRSPSELTTLMVEQYNLQRQLEAVQAQQQQILQQQQQYSYPHKPADSMPPPGLPRGAALGPLHSRSSSFNANAHGAAGVHRRTGSNTNGHNRRHSLGLNEAIKAAATQRQLNNRLAMGLPPQPPATASPDSESSFKFPAERAASSPAALPLFKFPPEPTTLPALLPPTPNFDITTSPERGAGAGGSAGAHQRRSSAHYRSNSRNFDPHGAVNMNLNWRHQRQPLLQLPAPYPLPLLLLPLHASPPAGGLEPPSFVPGHRSRNSSYGGGGGGGSISSLSHLMPTTALNGRKSLFSPYLPQLPLPDLIAEGRLVTGTLRVNKKNRSDAYVLTDGLLDADIFICGSKDRNRALEGDLVAVELLVVDEVWELRKEKEEKKRRKDNTFKTPLGDDIHNDATLTTNQDEKDDEGGLGRRGSLKQRPTMKKNDDVEVEGQSLLLVEEEEINDEVKPLYAGHVVAVVDRIPGQLFSGTLGLLRPSQAAQVAKDKKNGKELNIQTPKLPKIVWFKPTDKKVPLIAIPTEQAPKDFVENHESYLDQLFVASIKRWPITLLHPFGTLVSKLGALDDPATEIDSILRDNNFSCDEYGEYGEDEVVPSILRELPAAADEMAARREYLSEYVIAFTANGQFCDHAVHVKRLLDTKIELGYHVADVAYYVRPGLVLDRKAKKRSLLVFLPQKASHLLPPAVNEMVSFGENDKKLAVSVVFEIDTTNFGVEDLHIHESVVVPKQVVLYDTFDAILAHGLAEAVSLATCDYLKTLSLIAREFRRQRLNNRQLSISPNLTLLDRLDDEKVRLNLNIFEGSVASDVLSELGHKVNGAIAAKVHAGLGDLALLRRQLLPTLQKMETFVRKAKNLGVSIDTTLLASLQNSILAIEDAVKRQCIETLLYKCMLRGKYYVAGKQDPDAYGHYLLNMPLYTHFTAPLRRYIDIIVHRQLKTVLGGGGGGGFDLDSLKATADYCNFKKDCAANAQEQAIHLLLSQTIDGLSELSGQLLCMGTVVQVYDSLFDVFIPEIGVEKRVHGDQLPLVKAEFDKLEKVLELFWERGIDSATYIPPDEKTLLLYRSSIKNKHRTSAAEAAKLQSTNRNGDAVSITERLAKMHLAPPKLRIPQERPDTQSMPSSPARVDMPKALRAGSSACVTGDGGGAAGLRPYLQDAIVREENQQCIQEIRELKQVAVLIRAEIGMALPCLTVKILNPFY